MEPKSVAFFVYSCSMVHSCVFLSCVQRWMLKFAAFTRGSFVIQGLDSNGSRTKTWLFAIFGGPLYPILHIALHICTSIGHIQYPLHVGSNPYAWFQTVYCVSIILWRAHIKSQFILYRVDVNWIKEINLFYSILFYSIQ